LEPTDELAGELDLGDPAAKANWNNLIDKAARRFQRDDGLIHGFVDVLEGTPGRPAEARDSAVASETTLLESFVDQIRLSGEALRSDLIERVAHAIGRRRQDLAWDRELSEGLDLLPSPQTLQLAIEKARESDEGRHPLELPKRRLTDPSFLALLDVVERWCAKIEQYPHSYVKLKEDDLSNLLAVTLALAFGLTEREVFTREGKSDIYVPIAAIRDIAGRHHEPEDGYAFVAEAKLGTGPRLATDAVEQLEGYIPVRARLACLIFYVTAYDVAGAAERILDALRGRHDYVSDDTTKTTPFPLLRYRTATSAEPVTVAIAFVHLTTEVDNPA
jgi:hypothetical protein